MERNPEPRKNIPNNISNFESLPNGHIQHTQTQHISRSRTKSQHNVDISQEISKAVQSLKVDVERLTVKINSIQNANKSTAAAQKKFFGGMSPQFIVFVLIWPIVVNFIMNRFVVRRK
ncbi:hypothetical protein NQ314_018556 [Rhamnusium bicolor]|uniref:Uncharacterized protein n=1 Tax=Rhamnusium bicolor TaxID=1586634 RepID=A0AAV8WQ05_9CUCU|nr:hypothetical protein NQ314_018556 [Rhamnusium bicolor]